VYENNKIAIFANISIHFEM